MAKKETAEDLKRRVDYIEQLRNMIERAGGEVSTLTTRRSRGGTAFLKVLLPVERVVFGNSLWTIEDVTGRVGHIIGRPWNPKTGEIAWDDYGADPGAMLVRDLSSAVFVGDPDHLSHNRVE